MNQFFCQHPFSLYHWPYPSGHAPNHISTNLLWYSLIPPSPGPKAPAHQQEGPCIHWVATWGVATDLNWVKVRWLCMPLQDIDVVLFEPFWGLLRGVFSLIFPLEEEVRLVQPIKLHNSQEINLTNAGVQLSIHSTINPAYIPHMLSGRAVQSIRDSPPKLTIPLICWSLRTDPGFFHT